MNKKIQIYNGRAADPFDFEVERIWHPAGIAHSLAQINRFTGHAKFPYSSAQHQVLVYNMVSNEMPNLDFELGALTHDVTDVLFNDIASPVKHREELSGFYKAEKKAQNAIWDFLGIGSDPRIADRLEVEQFVAYWDAVALSTEANLLFDFLHPAWNEHLEKYPPHPAVKVIHELPWRDAAKQWLDIYNVLIDQKKNLIERGVKL